VIAARVAGLERGAARGAALLMPLSTWLLPALALLLPLAGGPLLADKFELPKVFVLTLGLVLVLAAVAARAVVDIGVLRLPAVRAALLFLGLNALATLASIEPRNAFFGSFDEDKGLLTLALMVGCFLLAATWVRTEEALARLVGGLALAAAIISLYSILQQVTVDPIAWSIGVADGRPVTATLGYPNSVGELLALSIPLTAWLAWQGRGLGRDLPLWSLLPQLVALWLTQARAAWLVVFAQAALLGPLVLCARWRLGRWPGTLLVLAPLAASLVVVVGLLFVPAPRWSSDDPILNRLGGYRGSPLESRQLRWWSTLELIADRPLLGWGPDSFALAYPVHRSAELDDLSNEVGREDNPHNLLLLTAVNSGLLGLAAYLAFQTAVVLVLLRAAFQQPAASEPDRRWAALALLLTLLSYQVLFLSGRNRVTTDWLAWLLNGAALGLFAPRLSWRWQLSGLRRLAPLLLAIGLLIEAVSGLLADAAFESGLQARTQSPDEALDSFRRAVLLRPFEPAYQQGLAVQLDALARSTGEATLFDEAVERFAAASSLYGQREAYTLMRLAQAELERDRAAGRRSDDPLDHAQRAIALDPRNPLLYLLAADLAGQLDRPALALEYLEAGRARIRSQDAQVLHDRVAERLGV
jgi:O-antigen ligase